MERNKTLVDYEKPFTKNIFVRISRWQENGRFGIQTGNKIIFMDTENQPSKKYQFQNWVEQLDNIMELENFIKEQVEFGNQLYKEQKLNQRWDLGSLQVIYQIKNLKQEMLDTFTDTDGLEKCAKEIIKALRLFKLGAKKLYNHRDMLQDTNKFEIIPD